MNIVEFPGLGLELNVNPIAFSVFGRPIYWYGILISLAFIAAVYLALKQSNAYNITQDDILDMVLFAGPIGILGARLYYVIFSWENYSDNILDVFKIWEGGLAIYGGIIAGVITAYVFSKVRKINTLKLFDFAVVYIPLAQGIGRWGNFFNQEAFGTNTTLPWGMTSGAVRNYLTELFYKGVKVDPQLPVHPTFFYEFVWDILIFFILLTRRKNKKVDGEVFLLYAILYGIGRFFIEGLRTDSLMLGSIRISQLLSAVFVFAAIIILFVLRAKANKITVEGVELGNSEYGNVLMDISENETTSDEAVKNNAPLEKENIEETEIDNTEEIKINEDNSVEEKNTIEVDEVNEEKIEDTVEENENNKTDK